MICPTGHLESSLLTRGSFWLKRHWGYFLCIPKPTPPHHPLIRMGPHCRLPFFFLWHLFWPLQWGSGSTRHHSLAPALGPVYTHMWDITNLPELCLWFILSGSEGKESTCDAGDPGSIPGSGRFPGERHGYPLQDSCLENSMDRGAWRVTVHGVLESRTRLSGLTLSLLI